MYQIPVHKIYIYSNGIAILRLLQKPRAGFRKFYRNLENALEFLVPDGRYWPPHS